MAPGTTSGGDAVALIAAHREQMDSRYYRESTSDRRGGEEGFVFQVFSWLQFAKNTTFRKVINNMLFIDVLALGAGHGRDTKDVRVLQPAPH
jgi:hypothetical protein